MYSLILMSAMSAAPEAPEFNGFFRNLLCFRGQNDRRGSGCSGSTARSNSCTGGCYGSRAAATGSCTGSCTGGQPAYASGCSGSQPAYASGGCTGSVGYSCFGSGSMPTMPNDGSPGDGYAQPMPAGSGYFTQPLIPFNYSMVPTAPQPYASFPIPVAAPAGEPIVRAAYTPADDAARGTVTVRLPANAELFAEGRRLNQTGERRRFVTPPLAAGADYRYTFRVEYVRNGETISRTKPVTIRAGATATLEFDDGLSLKPGTLTAPVGLPQTMPKTTPNAPLVPTPASVYAGASAARGTPERAKITVKLLPGTTLYIDGKKNERSELIREFNTPPVPQGQEYAYVMKAEIVRNGQPETQTMKVPFRAGETQQVDFTFWPGK